MPVLFASAPRLATFLVATLCWVLVFGPAAAQPFADAAPPAGKEAAPAVPDPLGRATPEGMVRGLLRAMADQDYGRAARYLNLEALPAGSREFRGRLLARDLQELLDKGGWVAANWKLSGDPSGQQDDRLPPEQDRFASVRTPLGTVDLIAERVAQKDGQIWLVSAETVADVPRLMRSIDAGLLGRMFPETLSSGPRIGGVPLIQWAALALLAVVAYLVAFAVILAAKLVLRRLSAHMRRERVARLVDAAALPLRIYLAVWIFALGTLFLGVSIVARQQFGAVAEVIGWVALGWLVWRIVDAVGEVSIHRMSRRSRVGAVSAVRFFRRGAKFAIIAIATVAALDTLGYDVTAGLAALGIGGLAIALGAQKTVENFVGSLTLIADQPVRVGDFCRFGATLGTVEDIGMRSTRVRTLDRTVVTVPNGDLSSLQIENFTKRDLYWFNPTLALRYETTPDQIRYLLVRLREVLYAHPRVDPDPARVRFLGLGAESLNIGIFSYVHAVDYNEFLEIQEDLTLRIMDVVAASGASFAFPSRTIYIAKDAAPQADRRSAAEDAVDAWRREGALQLPRFSEDRIGALKDSIAYPPEGSVLHQEEQPDLDLPPPVQRARPEARSLFRRT